GQLAVALVYQRLGMSPAEQMPEIASRQPVETEAALFQRHQRFQIGQRRHPDGRLRRQRGNGGWGSHRLFISPLRAPARRLVAPADGTGGYRLCMTLA